MQPERQYIPKEFVIGTSGTGYVRRRAEPLPLSLYPGGEESIASEDRFLAHLLGRPLTHLDRMDYYWEEQPEPVENESKERRYFAESNPVVKNAVSGVAWLGREAMSMKSMFRNSPPLRPAYKRSLNSDNANEKEMNSPVTTRAAAGGLSDTMISVIAGVLISFFIVFPLLRKGGYAIYNSIVESTVRKASSNASINLDGNASHLLPFLNRGSTGQHPQSSEEEHPTHEE